MYAAFFGLNDQPFAITPDPRYLFLSTRHAEALAHLVYGLNEAGGFIQLTGEVGTGKTTTIRSVLARAPEGTDIALIINPRLSPGEFVQTVCEELGLSPQAATGDSVKELVDALNRHLLTMHAAGRRVVLIVDEAQNLSAPVLEQLRLLTNLETESRKLMQIILIGQPELRDLLDRNELRQLAQRVTARYHLDPLSAEETAGYVHHRLRVAGGNSDIFPANTLREVYRLSRGVPRVINILCDRALLAAYTRDQRQVSSQLLRESASEVFDRRIASRWRQPLFAATAVMLVLAASLGAWRLALRWRAPALPPASAVVVAPPPAPAPALPALAAVLAKAGAATGADDALAGLLQLWHGNYQAGGDDACTQAARQQLECVSLRSSLAQLREFNRPAVLLLSGVDGGLQHVLLRALQADTARLQLGTHEATVGIADLVSTWYGDLILIWQPPQGSFASLGRGSRGPAVRELRRRLLQLHGGALVGESGASYDQDLVNLVEDFQNQHHLTQDGIAGLVTQLMLDSALASAGSPRLLPLTESP